MFKNKNIVNNFGMKKIIYLFVFMFIFAVSMSYNFSFYDTLKPFDLGTYSLFCNNEKEGLLGAIKIKNGDLYTYTFNSIKDMGFLVFDEEILSQEFRTVDGEKVEKYIQENSLIKVKKETIENIEINYYYCNFLPKKTVFKEGCFNIVIAQNNEVYTIGYPAIMSGF